MRSGRRAAPTASAGSPAPTCCAVCREAGIPSQERLFSLTDVYSADEAFVTGTFAGVVPVHTVDGRRIGDGTRGPMVERLQDLYAELVRRDVGSRTAPA